MQAIYTLKRGDKTAAQALLLPQIDSLIARGAQAIYYGGVPKFRLLWPDMNAR